MIDRGSGLDKMFIENATKNINELVSCQLLRERLPAVGGRCWVEQWGGAKRGTPPVAATAGSETLAERGAAGRQAKA
jgi:hypothetical protein